MADNPNWKASGATLPGTKPGLYTDNWRGKAKHCAWVYGEGWFEFESRAAAILWLVYMVGPSDWDCAVESGWQRELVAA